MGELSGRYREIWVTGAGGAPGIGATSGIGGIATGDPRVSRGENYRGLPWVMLDYPRVWGREDVFAIRTMFWWGHAFSVTLHLKGRYQALYLDVIRRHWERLAAAGFFVSINEDEWRHEHTPEVFAPMGGAMGAGGGAGGGGATEIPDGREFLKLSAAVGLNRWPEAATVLEGFFSVVVSVLREG